MQVLLIYLQWSRRNSLLKCVSQAEIAKNSLKHPILGVQGRSMSSILVHPESAPTVFVMISSKSVSRITIAIVRAWRYAVARKNGGLCKRQRLLLPWNVSYKPQVLVYFSVQSDLIYNVWAAEV